MSQITRCPSCATLFKVVPDQLRISEGWVRCGQCKEVFDATLSLQESPAPLPPAAPDPAARTAAVAAPGAWHPGPSGTGPVAPAMGTEPGLEPGPGQELNSGPGPAPEEQAQQPGPDQELHPDPHLDLDPEAPFPLPHMPQPPQVLQPQGYELPSAVLPDAQDDWAPDDSTPPAAPVTQHSAEDTRTDAAEAQAEANFAEFADFADMGDSADAKAAAAFTTDLPPLVADAPSPSRSRSLSPDPDSAGADRTAATEAAADSVPPHRSGEGPEQPEGRGRDAGADSAPPHPATLSQQAAALSFAALPTAAALAPVQAAAPVSPPLAEPGSEPACPLPSLSTALPAAGADRGGGAATAGDGTASAVAAAAAGGDLPPLAQDAAVAQAAVPDTAPEPSFVRTARRKALWHRPGMRLALGGCALLLAAALLAQVAVQQRHYLASAQPQWRPWLQALCAPLQCSIRPYQNIAAVAVDSSSFNKLRGTTYQFALALQNQSALAVAMPAVELTLTDSADQPVLRRVLEPAALSAPDTLAAGGAWSGSVQMELRLDSAAQARIAGYRVLAFYP